ncbi:endospore germination permease [Tumebacillus sp. ITR2]|uniref:Endospore germination permease n=2 Tax=Tumebacillus amylolyticus TaxID=2801339 RepID=A0ABS1J7Q6_9BACL|nr:endospore germination permease [Tumebacillus amylolyticus]
MMITMIVLGTTILFVPGLSIHLGGRDAWLAPLASGLVGLFIVMTLLKLSKWFPGQTPIQYFQVLFGKWLGLAIGLYLISVLLRQFATMIRELTDFTTTVTLTRTPPEYILILMLAVVYYGVRQGLEVVARVTQLVVIIELIQLVFSVVSLSTKDIDLDHLTPLFENGPLPFLRSSMFIVSWFGELLIVGFLLPSVRLKQGAKKAGIYGIGAVTVLLILANVYTLGVFGEVIASRLQYGLYEVARYISIANFLERLDPIVMGVWILLIYCKLAIFCYAVSIAVSQLFSLPDYRSVVGLVCLVGAVMSEHMYRHQADMMHFLEVIYPPYALLMALVGLPFLLFLGFLRKGKRKEAPSRA